MSAVRRFGFGLMLICIGATFPMAAYANEAIDTNEASQLGEASTSRAARLDIEVTLSQTEDEPLTYERTFSGNENEVVVAYWESNDFLHGSDVVLYDAVGQLVREVDYPRDILIDEFDGRSRAFLLPATGEYRFVFTSASEQSLGEVNEGEYLLRLRVASFYERAMMLAVERLDNDDFDGARSGFELAIEQRPESPMPYVGRLITMWYVTAAVFNEVGLPESHTLDGLYQLYQSLDAAEQATVLSDLQQIFVNFMAAVDAGVVETDTLDLDVSLIGDFADYLKTGEASEALRESIE